MRRRRPSRSGHPWATWPEEQLLDLRFRDLDLSIGGTWLQERVDRLHEELAGRGLRLAPHVWLSTEWFSPRGVPGIALPFYLAHPRLTRLERKKMLEAEGAAPAECLRVLRHEAGHAVQQAWQLHRRRRWQELFGLSSKPYPEFYRPNPASRRFVQHLRLYYAQSHPEEDFAETFAVWLRPRSAWRKRYAGWPALRKLEYVDELMGEIAGTAPRMRSRRRVDPLEHCSTTLREHYAEKTERTPPGVPDVFDRDLKQLFVEAPRGERASAFLRRNRVAIRRLVSRWTGEYQFILDQVLEDMIARCRELGLRAVGSETALRMDFAVLLTVATMHHLYSRKNWVWM